MEKRQNRPGEKGTNNQYNPGALWADETMYYEKSQQKRGKKTGKDIDMINREMYPNDEDGGVNRALRSKNWLSRTYCSTCKKTMPSLVPPPGGGP